MTNQLLAIIKLISIQPIGTENLLFKVLMIDRATEHVVNSTWPDGLQVELKLWMCAVLHVTFFSENYTEDQLFGQKFTCVLF